MRQTAGGLLNAYGAEALASVLAPNGGVRATDKSINICFPSTSGKQAMYRKLLATQASFETPKY